MFIFWKSEKTFRESAFPLKIFEDFCLLLTLKEGRFKTQVRFI